MPTEDTQSLLHRLTGGSPEAATEIIQRASTSTAPSLLVAAALVTGDTGFLYRATALANSTLERQLVVLARTHLSGDIELLDVLIGDHLAEHPDSHLASWIASHTHPHQ